MSQWLSKPSGNNRKSFALNAVVKLFPVSDSAEPAVQAWSLIVLYAEALLLPHQNSAGIVVPGWFEGLQQSIFNSKIRRVPGLFPKVGYSCKNP
jgi:hypothetical protein